MAIRKKLRRATDFLLYGAIAIGVFASVFLLAWYQVRTHQPPGLPLKWLGFAGMTAVVFGYALQGTRRWHSPRFWTLLAAFFAVHTGLGISVLWHVEQVPLAVYALLTAPEYVALASYLAFFMDSRRS
jgi:hypothetical protein